MIFASWRHNLATLATGKEQKRKRERKARRAIFGSSPTEDNFAAWRHNFDQTDHAQQSNQLDDLCYEDIFSSWRKNLFVKELKIKMSMEEEEVAEDVFADWRPNLNLWEDLDDPEDLADEHRLLKNKKRQLRKSHNLKRKRHF
jgi:hypothetical protein